MNGRKHSANVKPNDDLNEVLGKQFPSEAEEKEDILSDLTLKEQKAIAHSMSLHAHAEKIGVTPERLIEMRSFRSKLVTKFPHMKKDRIDRKVAEHFKIKIV